MATVTILYYNNFLIIIFSFFFIYLKIKINYYIHNDIDLYKSHNKYIILCQNNKNISYLQLISQKVYKCQKI